MCPICKTTLELSNSPAADQIRREITARHRRRQDEVRDQGRSGRAVRRGASWPRHREEGFNLLAWLLPLVGGAARRACAGARAGLPPAAARRASTSTGPRAALDEELARSAQRTSDVEVGAGRAVLDRDPRSGALDERARPLRREARPLSQGADGGKDPAGLPGRARLVRDALRAAARSGLPLGRLRDAARRERPPRRHERAAVSRRLQRRLRRVRRSRRGLGGIDTQTGQAGRRHRARGLRPRLSRAAAVSRGSSGSPTRSWSRERAGAARASCSAAPSRSAPHPAWGRSSQALSRSPGTTRPSLQGSLLLFVYSLGLALPFLAVGAGFGWATSASRWLRDRYRLLQTVGGAFLVFFGLLLFFGRDWWLNVQVNRLLDFLAL